MIRIIMLVVLFSTSMFAQNNSDFPRLTYEQMTNLASPTRLSHRIFYRSPTAGADGKWFDAVKRGDLALVKKFVDEGQNIEARDTASLNQTALGWAAFIGYLDIVKYLISKNANLYATDRADVKHVFKSAILGGHIDVIKYLYPLYKGELNLNEQDVRDGETALMVAVGNGRVEAVKFLLAQKVDVNIVSKQLNRNALSYACAIKNQELINLLTQAGATNLKTGKPGC